MADRLRLWPGLDAFGESIFGKMKTAAFASEAGAC